METKEKKKMSGWGKLGLFAGIVLLLWALPYIIGFIALMNNMNNNTTWEVLRLRAKAVPTIRANMQATPERFDEAAEVIPAILERTQEMGIESFSIERADEYYVQNPDVFAQERRGNYTLEEHDLQMKIYDNERREYWYLAIKNHPGLAPHEERYMTAEEKAFLLEFFNAMELHNIGRIQVRENAWDISFSEINRTVLFLVYLPTEEEKAAYENRSWLEYYEEILPDWSIYIESFPYA